MPTGIPAAQVLPPDHQLGMQVPKGGSMCGNCQFLQGPQMCGNPGFAKWNGSPQLPAPADEYCCDLYQPGQQSGGDEKQLVVKALQSGPPAQPAPPSKLTPQP